MGESQWFQPTIRNRLSKRIKLISLANPYNETSSAQGLTIRSKGQHEFGHCGREASPTGTEGSFDIVLDESEQKIAEVYWVCPFLGSNKIDVRAVAGFDIMHKGFSISDGALGKGTINVYED
ncbi:hypothetical protein EDC04DRAFT_2600390 [Pisolithus marmoratus]|nr:hypothetical protein EDC04DRAFT_2600390 [Pisolithus marmoratus]